MLMSAIIGAFRRSKFNVVSYKNKEQLMNCALDYILDGKDDEIDFFMLLRMIVVLCHTLSAEGMPDDF